MSQYTRLLKNRNFILYSVGQAFSQFGDRLVQIILIGFIYKRWPGSTFQLAKLFLFTVLPSFFISPIAGVYIDRWNKKYILIASDIFRAIAIFLVPFFFIYSENITPVYALVFLVFAAACFFLPARLAVIPALVSKEDLLLANSASSIVWVVSSIAGFSLGGILAEWAGIRNSLYVNSVVYGLSAVSFFVLAYSMKEKIAAQPKPPPSVSKIFKKSFLGDLVEGFRTLLFDRKIRFVIFAFFLLSAIMGTMYVVTVVFIQETLKSMTRDVGILGMCLFGGLLAGSYIYGKIGQRLPREKTVFLSLFLVGVFINVFVISLKVTGSFWVGSASAAILGFFISPIYVTANTVIHESIESKLRGRIFSSIGIIMNVGFLVFMFLSSILAEHIGKMWILIACGIGFLLFGIIMMLADLLKKATSSS